MAVIKGRVDIYRVAEDTPLGAGSCVLVVNQGRSSGTISVHDWQLLPQEADALNEPCLIRFQDGRSAEVEFTKYTASGCGPEVLRFTLRGPIRP